LGEIFHRVCCISSLLTLDSHLSLTTNHYTHNKDIFELEKAFKSLLGLITEICTRIIKLKGIYFVVTLG